MNRLLLVDGHNLLFQMFYGMPARITGREGKAIQGTLGVTGALLKIIRMTKPTHAAVIFDGQHAHARAALDAGYKANRPDFGELPEEENPFSQLPDVYAALDFLGVRYAETTDCEADDVIAGYALRFGGEMEVVISSFDSDFYQMITERVSVLRYRGEKTVICTPAYIRDKLGISPAQYADFKTLTGDKADNIPGIRGVGPKTAARLLGEYGTLQGVLANAERVAGAFVREAVIAGRERLATNYSLIRLSGCGALPFALEEMVFADAGLTTGEVLRAIGLR